jgi:hypothetical protein
MNAPTITLADFDRAVATSRRNLEQLIAEQANAEMLALAALTAQIEQSEAEKSRVDAEQRRQSAIDEFKANALACAQLSFADFHERANGLRAMARQAEDLHEQIISETAELQRDADMATRTLVDAMPEPSEDGASDCLMRAGIDGLNFSLPAWLQRMNHQRWMVPPSVNAGVIYQLGRALAAERQKKKR